METTRFETEILRHRLPGYLYARYGRAGVARHTVEPDSAWQATLSGPDLGRYTWTTFDDDELPRAVGMRLTGEPSQAQTFEIAEWYAPSRIVRGHWLLRPLGRWSELTDTEPT